MTSRTDESTGPTRRESMRFGDLTIEYDDRILTPRPWTLLQSRWAAELAAERTAGPLLELCSGAGHIGLAAAVLSGRPVTCVDIDPVACDFTRLNARRAGIEDRVEVRRAPLAEALSPGERFAVAVADPPWVTSDDVGRHPDDPLLAIDGGADGLDVARACVEACHGHLDEGASLLVQLGDEAQAASLAASAAAQGWESGGCRPGPPGRGLVLRLRHP